MMLKISEINISSIISILFILFVFVLLIDPAGTILPFKDVIFAAILCLIAVCYRNIDRKFLTTLLFLYSAITISLFRGWICGYAFNYDFTLYIYKTFAPLLLILWARNFRFFSYKSMILPGIIISLVTMLISFFVMNLPALEAIVYDYVQSKGLMLLSRRSILGIQISTAYYRSLPVLVFPSSILIYKFINEKEHRIVNGIGATLITIPLFLGGTRATFLSVGVIIFILIAQKMKRSNFGRFSLSFIAISLIPMFMMLVYKLVTETGEPSNAVKYGHLESYIDLIKDDPMILLFGSGPGSKFFSKGFNMFTEQTEWSYCEFARMFGIITTILLIIVYFYPLFKAYKRRNEMKYAFPFIIAYLIYLLIGGTNPLLIGSNGTLALIYGYNYVWSSSKTIQNNQLDSNG